MKICLNLVKNFCGDGKMLSDVQNEVNQIIPNRPIVKIEGKFIIASQWECACDTNYKSNEFELFVDGFCVYN